MEATRNLPDTELVTNLRSGIKMDDSIKALYRNYFEGLAWYVQHNNGNRQDAEDIFQDVVVSFIDLVQKDKFRGESSVKTFLFAMNRHAWLNELKRRGRALAREEKFERAQDKVSADAADSMVQQESTARVVELVEQLGDTCRKILLLFYYEDKSMKEILEEMDYENEQVVRNKKYKCLKQLEQMMNANPSLKQTLKTLLHG